MAKIIAVTGASGSQGGGVVNVMTKTPGWQVRAITRNPGSDASKTLASQGIEVVQADFDDEESLKVAFQGVHAVFAVTNWWEHLFRGKSPEEAGEIEEKQGMNIARAAATIETLDHFIWSTCPSAKKQVAGKHLTPHMDYKAIVDDRIKAELPGLAAKTTYLYIGYYPSNVFVFPFLKPSRLGEDGPHIQIIPTKPSAKVLVSGDMTINPGIWVRQVLATGARAFGKYANVALEKLTFQEMLACWSEVTGKPAVLVECTVESYVRLWGPAAAELALQFQYGELCDPWAERDDYVSPGELGIDVEEVVGFRGAIEKIHSGL
ncbi:unnamed protein product [Discula destructiva]